MMDTSRTILKIQWESLLDFVQAAKFKDVGNSTWQEGGTQSVLLASPQCFANLLEDVAVLPETGAGLVSCLEGLPYVRLRDAEGQYLASSLNLPHRLASGHIAYSKHLKDFRKRLQSSIETVGIHQAVFSICPLSLLHGVFFSHFPGGDRITRAISGSIVGKNAVVATVGMAAKDPIAANAKHISALGDHYDLGKKKPSAVGLGNIISNEAQYVCEHIETKLNIDHRLIDSYSMPDEAKQVMHLLALWKAAKLLSEPVRVRSGCDLLGQDVEAVIGDIPQLGDVEKKLVKAIATAKDLFIDPSELEFELPIVVDKSDTPADEEEAA